MKSTPSVPKPITKWPFFVGDGLCIAGTIAILSMAERPLAGGVAAAAVVCLVLGLALAITPYLIDFDTDRKLGEHGGDGLGASQIRKVASMAEQLNHAVSRSQSSAEQIEKALSATEESNDRLAALIENLSPDPGAAADQKKALDRIQEALTTLQSAVRMLSDSIERTAARIPEKTEDIAGPLEALKQQVAELSEELRQMTPPTQALTPVVPETELAGTEPESHPAPSGNPDDVVAPQPYDEAETEKVEPAAEETLPLTEDEVEAGTPEEETPKFVFNEHSTSIIATAYIGIGNKLFLRGNGPGLSWEKGVPMQFLSIGKWGWSALEVTEPITCRIYRNDDEPAIDGDIEIQPSELREISPRF